MERENIRAHALQPFRTMMAGGFYSESAPDWFLANAAGPVVVRVFDAPRPPVLWHFEKHPKWKYRQTRLDNA